MMKPWKIYSERNTNIIATFRNSECIIEVFGECLSEFFSTKKRTPRNQLVKTILAQSGHTPMKDKPQYKVYCNGLEEALCQPMGGIYKNAEWLYDLIWYSESTDYLLTPAHWSWNVNGTIKEKETEEYLTAA